MANKKTRKVRVAAKARPKAKAQKNPKSATTQPLPKSVVSQNRSGGLRLFKLAGRPTKEQFRLVYGEKGPLMTWDQRAAFGCSRLTLLTAEPKSGSSRKRTVVRPRVLLPEEY